jgi:hypothetical protein
VVSGALPAGLTLSAGGGIDGTPSAAGSAAFTVQVRDSASSSATADLTIAVVPAVTIATASLPVAIMGVAYAQVLSAAGGAGGYTWSIASGSPPPGISLQSNGALTGTPAAVGNFSFTARVTDAASAQATRAFIIAVATPVSITTPDALPAGVVGAGYAATLSASGGNPPYRWSIGAGELPNGLALNAGTGAIAGAPTLAGTFTFTAVVTDSNGLSASTDFAITIRNALAIATGATQTAAAGSPYSQALAASGGTPPYSWSLVSGTLPTGLSFNAASAAIEGTPTQVGTFPLTFQVSDAASGSVRGNFTLTVASGLTIATAPALPAGGIGAHYSVALQPAGGTPPYVWAVTAGSLPGGLTFNAGGQIDGTPTMAGTFTFTAQVTDGNSNRASKQFTLAVAGALTITTGPALPDGQAGSPYQQTLAAAGGSPPYLWSVTAGSLPPGLTLQGPTGLLNGTPTAAGSFNFTVTLTDSASVSAQKQFTLAVGVGVSFTTPASLPNATVGAAYSFALGASGGQPPYSWSITQGSAPPGLSLNASTGVISGTPTAQGTYNFTVQVADSAGAIASRVHSIATLLPTAAPDLAINGLGATVSVLQQPAIDITLSSPYPISVTGRLNVSFSPGGANPANDPSIQFSTGGRSAAFTIPANSLHAIFDAPQFAVQVGSVAGTLTFTIDSLQVGNTPLQTPGSLTVQVDAGPPAIRGVTVVRTADGFQVQVVAVSSTRELTQATVRFQPSAGSSLQTAEANVPLGEAAKAWFQSAASAQYGGQFTLTLPFTFVSSMGGLDSVSVALTNSVGNSPESSASY